MSDFLNEMGNKLDALLDNQLKICLQYSSIVMLKYKSLLTMLNIGDESSLSFYLEMADELKDYLLKEYDAYEKLLIYDKAHLIPRLDLMIEQKTDDINTLRLQNKLKFIKSIFAGFKVTARELLIDDVPNDIRFDVNSALLALMYIKIFKNIKVKIDSLTCDGKQDVDFCDLLNKELNFKVLYKMCENDLFEMIGIFYNLDIEKFPDISIDVLKRCLSKKFRAMDVEDEINQILLNLLVNDINMIRDKQQLENNSEDVFEYLYFCVRLDTIMLYMNKEYLQKLHKYCCDIYFKNRYVSCDVRNKIKRRIAIEK